MKALFFVIVLANLGLFMWEYRNGAFAPVVQAPLINKEPLLLLSEVKNTHQEAQVVSESEPKAPEVASNESSQNELSSVPPALPVDGPEPASGTLSELPQLSNAECYEAGPFEDLQSVQSWISQVQGSEHDIKTVDRDDQIISGYMVYKPAEKTPEQSQEVLKMLKDKGITDVLLQGDEISLGVFNSEDRALVLKNELQAKGFAVQIKPRYKTKTRKYIQVLANEVIMQSLQKRYNNDAEFVIKALDACP